MGEIKTLNFAPLRLKAYKAIQENNFDYAIAALDRCVRLNPNDPLARRYLAFALLSDRDTNLGLTQYSAWNKLDTIPFADKINFGKALIKANGSRSQDSAKAYFDVLANEQRGDAKNLIDIAITCTQLGIYEGPTTKALTLAAPKASEEQSTQIIALQYKIESSRSSGKTQPVTNSFTENPSAKEYQTYLKLHGIVH
jgi:tetratricopeptide (TPR) repeat protein